MRFLIMAAAAAAGSLGAAAAGAEKHIQPSGVASLELNKGWVAYGGAYRRPGVMRQGGVCMLSGLVKVTPESAQKVQSQMNGKEANRIFQTMSPKDIVKKVKATPPYSAHIATLSTSCRPSGRLIFTANLHEGSGRVDILPDGGIVFVAGNLRHRWISLDGISFYVGDQNPGKPVIKPAIKPVKPSVNVKPHVGATQNSQTLKTAQESVAKPVLKAGQ